MSDTKTNRCPVMHGSHTDTSGDAMQRWFPDRLNLDMLRRNTAASNPLDPDFDYAKAFAELDVGHETMIDPMTSCLRRQHERQKDDEYQQIKLVGPPEDRKGEDPEDSAQHG